MPNSYTVYRHVFPNGKQYIGITMQDPVKRWNGGSGYRKQPKIMGAIIKYGWDNIRHEVLLTGLTKAEAEEAEIMLISAADSIAQGYNVDTGGNTTGTHSAETRKKISEGNKGKNAGRQRNDGFKANLRAKNTGGNNPFYGKHHSEETRAAHAVFMQGNTYFKGHHHTEDFKREKSEQMRAKYKDGGNPRCRAVEKINQTGKTTYKSLRTAAEANNLPLSSLFKAIKLQTEYGGSKWRYCDGIA